MHKTDRMYEKRWGVFVHYLHGHMNNPECYQSMGKETSWTECVGDFNCELFAKQLADVGAGYLILTIMQQTKYMIAPNSTYDKIAGFKPGEACSEIDLVERMYDALSKYDIDLFLYYTGDGPVTDENTVKAFGAYALDLKLNDEFVQKWADVAREYSLRYGDKVKGWWHDGCWINYTDERLHVFSEAFRAGNPDAVVASNMYGCIDGYSVLINNVRSGARYDDYTAGEIVHLGDVPYAPFIGHTRWHILSFLGVPPDKVAHNGWGKAGTRYTPGWMLDYVRKIHDLGGVITLDIGVYRDGRIVPEQLEVLAALKNI